ncbi:efflux RND transporter permease subunit [Pseudoalteromonas peptidolytica]|uniref:efflux RND transporter permease subunit n=1 Tax=Pseudoalteromonas peptidolytica TaxID=61150 RepID=UPI00298DEAC8|nr:efflux RND transporter permease subunit [Pseudoalteromonas peptidolytica]MDW7549102.1 efflux RND transporter permease subunit [Pseudoalteromonas peptidolytica]
MGTDGYTEQGDAVMLRNVIAWFIKNPIAVNLLMLFLLIGGVLSFLSINKQLLPLEPNQQIEIIVEYPGASAAEVKIGVTEKIENALQGLPEVRRMVGLSNKELARVRLTLSDDSDAQQLLARVKREIDALSTLPVGIERPVIEYISPRHTVMFLALYGSADQKNLKMAAAKLQRELLLLPEVQYVDHDSGRDFEVSIEVDPDALRRYGLTMTQLSERINAYSINQTGGFIRNEQGEITVRMENQAYRSGEFATIPVLTLSNGATVPLGEVATVNDTLADGAFFSSFDGKPARIFQISAAPEQDIAVVSEAVERYLATHSASLEAGLTATAWLDFNYYVEGRLDMMMENLFAGALLVFVVLSLFLRPRIAMWVMAGIPISYLGTMMLLPMESVSVTLNLMSMFGFILVLGIVVDDAIVVSESVYHECERTGYQQASVIKGVEKVSVATVFGVLTTVTAFLPLLFVEGESRELFRSIGFVVVFAMLFSIIESKLILPAHLAAIGPKKRVTPVLDKLRDTIALGMQSFIRGVYEPVLRTLLPKRWPVVSAFFALFMVAMGMLSGGHVKWIGDARVPHDFPSIQLRMESTASEAMTVEAIRAFEQSVLDVDKSLASQYGQGMVAHTAVILDGPQNAELYVKLVDDEARKLDTFALAKLWRQALPNMPGLKEYRIQETLDGDPESRDIQINVVGEVPLQVDAAAKQLEQKLNALSAVYDVTNSQSNMEVEVRLALNEMGQNLGLTPEMLMSQVTTAIYGIEVQRVLRDSFEVKVMLKYPQDYRAQLHQLDNIYIHLDDGTELLFTDVATYQLIQAPTEIRSDNGRQNVVLMASVDPLLADPDDISDLLEQSILAELSAEFPGLTFNLNGELKEQQGRMSRQAVLFLLSLFGIYALLAIPLRSYKKPLLILSVLPFCFVGAVFGHWVMGLGMSVMSLFGVIAALGVAVNDALILLVAHSKPGSRIVQVASQRFMAITLTSLTTFIGLLPLMFETDLQAHMVIPMAVSLAFGVIASSFATLFMLPVLLKSAAVKHNKSTIAAANFDLG